MSTTLFGTDGIRSRVGTPPFTHEFLPKLAASIAQWIVLKKPSAHVLIGTDSRISQEWIKSHIVAALLSQGIHVYDGHVLPTPLICTLVMDTAHIYDFGIVISASHNPFYDNGIKLISTQGKISAIDEEKIQELVDTFVPLCTYNFSTSVKNVAADCVDIYTNRIRTFFPPGMLEGVKIVLDCAHGATSFIAAHIFTMFGASVITLNNNPTGLNINKNCGSLYPESLTAAVVTHSAMCGFAFDGDGDRLIAVDKTGGIVNGDDILALLSTHPLIRYEEYIAATVMSSLGLIQYLTNQGKKVITTPVGDKHVLAALELHNALLGGEQSGHIVMRDYSSSGDGIFTALRVLETMLAEQSWQMKRFKPWPQITTNIPVDTKIPLEAEPLSSLINSHRCQLSQGRLLVRYSGTENILRIMVEDKNEDTAHLISQSLIKGVQAVVKRSKELA